MKRTLDALTDGVFDLLILGGGITGAGVALDGVLLYDLLAGAGNLHRSHPYLARQLTRDFPELRAVGLCGGARFHDAQMDDARLCLEVVRTAALHGAVVANYVEGTAFEFEGGR